MWTFVAFCVYFCNFPRLKNGQKLQKDNEELKQEYKSLHLENEEMKLHLPGLEEALKKLQEEKEEALILVKWENKKLWKNISMEEVNEIQERFEKNVQESLQLNTNPFVLLYESELQSQ